MRWKSPRVSLDMARAGLLANNKDFQELRLDRWTTYGTNGDIIRQVHQSAGSPYSGEIDIFCSRKYRNVHHALIAGNVSNKSIVFCCNQHRQHGTLSIDSNTIYAPI